MSDDKLRLDKWLWFARVVKTRAAAADLCEKGRVRLNGERIDKAHKAARIGDVVTVAVGSHVKVLKIVGFAERRGSYPDALKLYEDLSPPAPPRLDKA